MTEAELLAGLKALPAMRIAVENLDNALSILTPEERIMADLLFIHPCRGNIEKVCKLLNVEIATAYRRRKLLLCKLQQAIIGISECKMHNA